MKVFTILVSYFDDELERSKLEHYNSVECIDISAKILSEKILNAFIGDNIPLENLISDLSDSASHMRDKKRWYRKKVYSYKYL